MGWQSGLAVAKGRGECTEGEVEWALYRPPGNPQGDIMVESSANVADNSPALKTRAAPRIFALISKL
jgi:hypothetical protein